MPPDAAPQPTATVDVVIHKDMPWEAFPIMLLGTLATPPTSPEDPRWCEALELMRLRVATERAQCNGEEGSLETVLNVSAAVAHRKEKAAWVRINRAMVAAHAVMPFVIGEHAKVLGDSLATAAAAYRKPKNLQWQIHRVMSQESALARHAARRGTRPPPKRMPEMSDSEAGTKNFITRVLRPARPILHIAISLAQAMDTAELQALKTYRTPRLWEREGYGTGPADDSEDGVAVRPRVTETMLLLRPEFSRQVIGASEAFLPAVQAYLASGRAKPVPMVRLLLE
ncbi:hypothetical protein [Sediminicoccus rosea]|uniref:Uncharacterized protein n=1 Tax=Sediminicoccus rosea TaxID=1225128 RepID=A0ABZ0PE23_9PROT|nr:hypothetical protein [Sediminicoccus rosea]WPB83958.1 hypothetical protein R9Z33_17835 [Sediminicoccus rosea]